MMKKVAIVCANGLGDGLIFMVLSHNFFLSGYEVTTFSTPLAGLKSWFPRHTILPFPARNEYETVFSSFDHVIAADNSILVHHSLSNARLTILKEGNFNKKKTLVENLSDVSRDLFFLPYSEKNNGIVIPSHLQHRKFPSRLIIHPMSLEAKRCWPARKFLKVAESLLSKGVHPTICVSPSERPEWESLLKERQEIAFPLFPTLHDLACYVYESGWMIGNNSGIGHLASNMGIPTLSLFARKSYANLWRPGWGGAVVSPPKLLPGAPLMNQYWKALLTPRKVIRAFHHLRKRH